MSSYPYNAKYAPIPVPDLENWNTDRTVDTPVMLRGGLIKGAAGWTYDTGEAVKYTTHIDEATDAITYIGKAVIGSATSAASWQIMRISATSASYTYFQWADSDDNFDNIFDNRASKTYS